MPPSKNPRPRFPVKLYSSQREALAEIAPALADRLKLNRRSQRVFHFTAAELKELREAIESVLRKVSDLRLALIMLDQAIAQSRTPPDPNAVYQFKITLLGSRPPIWRRIQVKDCTLDKLHEHIQTAMGWTNSHLNRFKIGEQEYSDPMLMEEDFEEFGYRDSTTTRVSDILPGGRKRLRFHYQYDFGDNWEHEVLFEGAVPAEPRAKYPRCVDGARACPPEDCGGIGGYAHFVKAIQDPEHERHEQLLYWVGGAFDPEKFDPAEATKAMRKGLPDWRRMEGW
jgi:hypothetical protein